MLVFGAATCGLAIRFRFLVDFPTVGVDVPDPPCSGIGGVSSPGVSGGPWGAGLVSGGTLLPPNVDPPGVATTAAYVLASGSCYDSEVVMVLACCCCGAFFFIAGLSEIIEDFILIILEENSVTGFCASKSTTYIRFTV